MELLSSESGADRLYSEHVQDVGGSFSTQLHFLAKVLRSNGVSYTIPFPDSGIWHSD